MATRIGHLVLLPALHHAVLASSSAAAAALVSSVGRRGLGASASHASAAASHAAGLISRVQERAPVAKKESARREAGRER